MESENIINNNLDPNAIHHVLNQENSLPQNEMVNDVQDAADQVFSNQNGHDNLQNLGDRQVSFLKQSPIDEKINPNVTEDKINIVEIDINAIQTEVNALNDPNKSTQEVLKNIKAKLEERGMDPQLSSSLKKENGSYIVEHYISPGSDGGSGKVCYKINAIYTFKDGERTIKIERPIYTTIPAVEGRIAKDASAMVLNVKSVGVLASKYKDLMVSEATQDGRIRGYKTEAQRSAAATQRAFIMKLSPKGKSIEVEYIKPYGTPELKKVDITLNPKPIESKYVKSLLINPENSKIKGIRKDVNYQIKENELEYSTKEEAILKASFKVKEMNDDTSFVDSLLKTNEIQEYLKNTKENIHKKQEEIKQLKNQLEDSSWLGLKKKESKALSQFINDRSKESSDFKQIEERIKDLSDKLDTNQKQLGILENFQKNKEEYAEQLKMIIKTWVPDEKNKNLNDIEITEEKVEGLSKFLNERSERIKYTLNQLNEKKQEDERIKSKLENLQRLNQELELMNSQLYSIYKTAGKNLKSDDIDADKKDNYKKLISLMNKSHRSGIKKVNAEIELNKKSISSYKTRLNIEINPLKLEEDEFMVGDTIINHG